MSNQNDVRELVEWLENAASMNRPREATSDVTGNAEPAPVSVVPWAVRRLALGKES